MTDLIELKISDHAPFADGHEFGSTGTYERLVGRAHFAIDPTAAAQRGITDLEHAAQGSPTGTSPSSGAPPSTGSGSRSAPSP